MRRTRTHKLGEVHIVEITVSETRLHFRLHARNEIAYLALENRHRRP